MAIFAEVTENKCINMTGICVITSTRSSGLSDVWSSERTVTYISAKTDTPRSAVSLRQLSCLLSFRSYIPKDHVSEIKFIIIIIIHGQFFSVVLLVCLIYRCHWTIKYLSMHDPSINSWITTARHASERLYPGFIYAVVSVIRYWLTPSLTLGGR